MNVEERKKKKEELLEVLKTTMGNVGSACALVKIGRRTFYDWKEADEEFKKKAEVVVGEQREEMHDYAENKLFEHIKAGNIASLIFYLKTRHPGYKLKFKFEGKIKTERKLSEEEKEFIRQALKNAGNFRKPGDRENSK